MRNEILVLMGVLLISGCVSQSSPDQEINTSELNLSDFNRSEAENVTTVYYTDAGFIPDEVTVNQGDKVVFVDESENPMWVASDNHPRHTKYDGNSLSQHCSGNESPFDQCQEGNIFEFTFEKQGTWDYHNHRRSGHGGTVIVE